MAQATATAAMVPTSPIGGPLAPRGRRSDTEAADGPLAGGISMVKPGPGTAGVSGEAVPSSGSRAETGAVGRTRGLELAALGDPPPTDSPWLAAGDSDGKSIVYCAEAVPYTVTGPT